MKLRSTGREIDTSCPFSGQCWAEQGCAQECPPTVLDALDAAARAEHFCKMLPHTDPELAEVCPICHLK